LTQRLADTPLGRQLADEQLERPERRAQQSLSPRQEKAELMLHGADQCRYAMRQLIDEASDELLVAAGVIDQPMVSAIHGALTRGVKVAIVYRTLEHADLWARNAIAQLTANGAMCRPTEDMTSDHFMTGQRSLGVSDHDAKLVVADVETPQAIAMSGYLGPTAAGMRLTEQLADVTRIADYWASEWRDSAPAPPPEGGRLARFLPPTRAPVLHPGDPGHDGWLLGLRPSSQPGTPVRSARGSERPSSQPGTPVRSARGSEQAYPDGPMEFDIATRSAGSPALSTCGSEQAQYDGPRAFEPASRVRRGEPPESLADLVANEVGRQVEKLRRDRPEEAAPWWGAFQHEPADEPEIQMELDPRVQSMIDQVKDAQVRPADVKTLKPHAPLIDTFAREKDIIRKLDTFNNIVKVIHRVARQVAPGHMGGEAWSAFTYETALAHHAAYLAERDSKKRLLYFPPRAAMAHALSPVEARMQPMVEELIPAHWAGHRPAPRTSAAFIAQSLTTAQLLFGCLKCVWSDKDADHVELSHRKPVQPAFLAESEGRLRDYMVFIARLHQFRVHLPSARLMATEVAGLVRLADAKPAFHDLKLEVHRGLCIDTIGEADHDVLLWYLRALIAAHAVLGAPTERPGGKGAGGKGDGGRAHAHVPVAKALQDGPAEKLACRFYTGEYGGGRGCA